MLNREQYNDVDRLARELGPDRMNVFLAATGNAYPEMSEAMLREIFCAAVGIVGDFDGGQYADLDERRGEILRAQDKAARPSEAELYEQAWDEFTHDLLADMEPGNV